MAINHLELRSGNLILDPSDDLVAVGDIVAANPDWADSNPAPIDAEMLVSAGFRQLNNQEWWDLPGTDINIRFYPEAGKVWPALWTESKQFGNGIDAVHNLQNYVFAASGVELAIPIPA